MFGVPRLFANDTVIVVVKVNTLMNKNKLTLNPSKSYACIGFGREYAFY